MWFNRIVDGKTFHLKQQTINIKFLCSLSAFSLLLLFFDFASPIMSSMNLPLRLSSSIFWWLWPPLNHVCLYISRFFISEPFYAGNFPSIPSAFRSDKNSRLLWRDLHRNFELMKWSRKGFKENDERRSKDWMWRN